MTTPSTIPTIDVNVFGEAPWFALASSDPQVATGVVALATYHVATVHAACAELAWANHPGLPRVPHREWLHGVACGYLHGAIEAGDIVWNGEQWVPAGPPSVWAWLQKVWKRLWA